MKTTDCLQRFIFENCAVRGEWVRLEQSFQKLKSNADYPQPVQVLLGEAVAAIALLSATIKFKGSLTLQISGSGPVNLLIVQATGEKTFRGLAHWDKDRSDFSKDSLLSPDSHLVITIDPGEGKERYQGVVELIGSDLARSLENYFLQSEQLPTRFWLVCDGNVATGFLLQEMPNESSADEDAWNRLTLLADTVTPTELINTPVETLLTRLYHEERTRLFDAEKLAFFCNCSRDRVAAMVKSLGRDEAESILNEQKTISIGCEFCHASYHFDAVDVGMLFSESGVAPFTKRRQ